jgi:hypothetical protein
MISKPGKKFSWKTEPGFITTRQTKKFTSYIKKISKENLDFF